MLNGSHTLSIQQSRATAKHNSPTLDIHSAIQLGKEYILASQNTDGAICWYPNSKLDPWDHTEAAMALTIAGEPFAAKNAYRWLLQNQNKDGSWFAHYFLDDKEDPEHYKIETNFVAYIATGLWHYYLVTSDLSFLKASFSTLERAIDFVISLQTEEGDIQWAISTHEKLPQDALVTACSSILRSLESAIKIADTLNESKPDWQCAYQKLFNALRNKPERFDRSWESKSRFSMDWFYPVLSGALSKKESIERLKLKWHEFYVEDLGCRCVNDQPWVTIAETCELVLSLVASGQKEKAKAIHQNLVIWQDTDGGFWTGYNFKNDVIWPREKTSWTGGAFILAADAIYGFTSAQGLFTSPSQYLKNDVSKEV